jgi:hypothetical protein
VVCSGRENQEAIVIDAYTKIVLTVIAVALVVIVMKQGVPSGSAQIATDCGGQKNPCHLYIVGGTMSLGH